MLMAPRMQLLLESRKVFCLVGGACAAALPQGTGEAKVHNDDQRIAIEIGKKAISWLARQIAINADEDSSVVVGKSWKWTSTPSATTHRPASTETGR